VSSTSQIRPSSLDVEEIANLFQLALVSAGRSLDVTEVCDAFVKTLGTQNGLAFSSVWIRESENADGDLEFPSQVTHSGGAPHYELAYAHPRSLVLEERIDPQHPLAIEMSQSRVVNHDFSTAQRRGYLTEALDNGSHGWITVIPLQDVGFIKLVGTATHETFTPRHLDQITPVFERFAATLRGCLDHARMIEEKSSRRYVQTELAALSGLHAQLLDALPIGILFENAAGKVQHVNQTFCDLMAIEDGPKALIGLGCEEILQRTSRLFADPDTLLERTMETACSGVEVQNEVFRLRDGRVLSRCYRPVSLGELETGGLWQIREITAEQQREDDLSRLSLVASRTDNAVIITDRYGNTEWVNEAFTRLTSYESHEVRGRKPGDILQGPLTNEETKREIGKALRAGEGYEGQILNYTKAGTTYWLDLTITPIFDEAGEPVRFIAIESDCTERLKADEALRQSEQRMRLLLENALDAVVELDDQGKIRTWNRQAETTFGWQAAETIGQNFNDLVSPEQERAERLARVKKRLRSDDPTEKTRRVETTFVHRSGETFPGEFSLYPIEQDGETILTAFVRDITERRMVDRMKDELVSTVSHELRTPLTGMQGFVELMLDRDYPREQRREFLGIVQKETFRLGRLIDDFLDLQRIEGGRLRYDFAIVQLPELVDESIRLFSAQPSAHRIYTDLDDNLPAVKADPNRLRQVLKNLLSNAIKFSEPGSEIVVSAVWTGTSLRLSVEDQGCGIPEKDLPHVFEKFYRVESFDAQVTGGSGLGLPIVQQIITDHGGTISVTSRPGEGSTFSFELPVARVSDRATEDTR